MRLIDADALIPVTLTDGGYWTKEVYYKTDVDAAPTIYPPSNAPLTLEELRGMDGQPVWIESLRNAKNGKYVIFDGYDQVLHCFRVIGGGLLDCTVMGRAWLAYRRRPEDAEHNV